MKQLGKYEILGPLGTGGMGTVYRARDTILERDVALKTISTAEADPELKERFYREARACARLQHPHIVTIYELGEQDQIAFIAMELLAGEDLRRTISERRPASLETKLEWMAQVCEGLAHAHRHDIIHRDIKPGNIFLQSDQGAKILDFGIARVMASTLTRVGTALGTPDYMAPEQIAGKRVDSRCDLFSAAIVFFEFFSGRHPFAGANVAWRIVREAPSALRSVDPSLPEALEAVIARGLEKEPERRYQTGDEFAAALRAVVGQARRGAADSDREAEELRAEILAERAAWGEFEQCQKVREAFQRAGADWSVLEGPRSNDPRDAWLGRLQQLRLQQQRVLEPARASRQALQLAQEFLRKGDRRRSSQALTQVEAEFADHPQVAALCQELAAPTRGRGRRAPQAAPEKPEENHAAARRRVEELAQRLLGALEEQDRAATEETASLLRPLLDDWGSTGGADAAALRARAEQVLLRADFELQLNRFSERIAEADVAGAEHAFQALAGLPLEASPHVEAREQARRQLEQARHHEDPAERRIADFQTRLQEFYGAVGRNSVTTSRWVLERLKEFAAADGRFASTVVNCEKQMAEVAAAPPSAEPPEPAPPRASEPASRANPVLEALRLRVRQLHDTDPPQCVSFVDSLGRQHQSDPDIAALKQSALEEINRQQAAASPPAPPSRPEQPRSPFEPPTRAGRSKTPVIPPLAEPAAPAAASPPVEAPPKPAPAIPPLAAPAAATPTVEPAVPPPAAVADPPATTPTATSPPPASEPPAAVLPPVAEPSRLPPQRARRPAATLSSQQKALLGGAAAVLLLVAGLVVVQVVRKSKPVELAPAEATAEVTAPEARLVAAAGAAEIVALRKGDRCNVLSLPSGPDAVWVAVQFVDDSGKVFPPGRLKVAEVGKWRSEKPDAELHLLKTFGPGEAAPEPELREQLYKLAGFVSRFGITPQGPQAKLEMARVNLALARIARQAGRPASDWQPHLDAAAGQLAMASAGAELAGQVVDLRKQMEALGEPAVPPPAARPPRIPAPPRPEDGVRRAEDAWKRGRYGEALRSLDRVLRDRPGYTPALALREKVRRAQQLETGR